FDGDGKADLGVLYNGGENAEGKGEVRLFTFAGRAEAVAPPAAAWDSRGFSSWRWYRSDLA
ncbi:hypothetical protein, partial [Streptomyces huiliensis]|uniref:hypothetical protein n=1 Tax=Streptomyces huiliensis TaxID=2876027 RepID=UPI001CBA794B